jgi:hypothetical protein
MAMHADCPLIWPSAIFSPKGGEGGEEHAGVAAAVGVA